MRKGGGVGSDIKTPFITPTTLERSGERAGEFEALYFFFPSPLGSSLPPSSLSFFFRSREVIACLTCNEVAGRQRETEWDKEGMGREGGREGGRRWPWLHVVQRKYYGICNELITLPLHSPVHAFPPPSLQPQVDYSTA